MPCKGHESLNMGALTTIGIRLLGYDVLCSQKYDVLCSQKVHIHYHYGTRFQKTIPTMVLDGFGDQLPELQRNYIMDPLGFL